MLHLLSKPAAPVIGPASARVSPTRHTSTPVLITEQEVVFSTAAATLLPAATAHRRWPGTTLIAAIGHVHIRLHEPRPIYPRREASYFEAARMSRQMGHL
jgi:hypothetical protein